MLKKVPKVAVLPPICSDLGRDSLYSNEMHRARELESLVIKIDFVNRPTAVYSSAYGMPLS